MGYGGIIDQARPPPDVPLKTLKKAAIKYHGEPPPFAKPSPKI